MRVAILSLEHDDYATEFANAVSHQAKVGLFVAERFYGDRDEYLSSEVDLHVLDWPRLRQLRNIPFVFRLSRYLAKFRPDVIHIIAPVFWLALLIPLVRAPIVTTIHDVGRHPGDKEAIPFVTYLRLPLLHGSKALIVHGETLREAAASTLPRRPIHVVPHIAVTRYASLARKEGYSKPAGGPFNVLFFGRIFPYKGLEYLLKSQRSVLAQVSDVHYTIAGRGDISAMRSLIGDPARTTIMNRFVPDSEAARLFTEADVIVLPYIEASESGVAAIATAFGKPAIATAVGELPDTITHMVNGLVVPPRDAEKLADAVVTLARDRSLCERLARGAREQAEGSRGGRAVGRMAEDIYTQIVPSAAARPRSGTDPNGMARAATD